MKRRVRIAEAVLLFWVATAAFGGEWRTLTNAAEIRAIAVQDSFLWAATNGGVLRIDMRTRQMLKFTNTEGLAQIDVVTVAYDPRGYVWAAMPDGLLQIYDIAADRWDSYNELQNRLRVFAVCPGEDFVLIGTDIGVAELRLDKKNRWERTWKAEIGAVKRLAIVDGAIWAAQKDGLRRIALDFPNKQIPSAWQRFSLADGLTGEMNDLVFYEGLLAAAGEGGLVIYDGSVWSAPEPVGQSVRALTVRNGELCAASQQGVFQKRGGSWVRLGNAGSNVTALAVSPQGTLWAGTAAGGFLIYDDSQNQWLTFLPDGPGSNLFADLLIDREGHLWAASSKNPTGGVYYFNGRKWINFTRSSGLPHYDFRTLAEDSRGRIWAGSWGGGVTLFEKIGQDSVVFTPLGDVNGGLSGIDINPTYVVVTKIRADDAGRLWFLNYAAADKKVLRVYDLENRWQSWSTAEGIRSFKVVDLAFDGYGRKWIASEDGGVSVLDDNGTPFDKSDDDLSGYLAIEDGLESNNVRALAEDLDGTLWIGTSLGLNYWFGGRVGVRYNVINDAITALLVDPRNNKWIGTAGGLSILDADNYSWRHYSTSNSPLPSDVITCFAFNENTGDMYIGTTNGLSVLETPYTKPEETLDFVVGYPNPFIIDQPGARFYIDRLAYNSSVRIFTPEGFLVRTLSQREVLGARVAWDGRNDQGEEAADGIYIFLVVTRDGRTRAGKVALIRR